MKNRRLYDRQPVVIDGTIFKCGYDIPVRIDNISENGVGIRINNAECPADFIIEKGETFQLVFYDTELDIVKIVTNQVQESTFKVVHIRKTSADIYVGAKLVNSKEGFMYEEFVKNKKVQIFVAKIRFEQKKAVNM